MVHISSLSSSSSPASPHENAAPSTGNVTMPRCTEQERECERQKASGGGEDFVFRQIRHCRFCFAPDFPLDAAVSDRRHFDITDYVWCELVASGGITEQLLEAIVIYYFGSVLDALLFLSSQWGCKRVLVGERQAR